LGIETPTMLLAAGAAAAMLVGIYLFQHRYRRQTVSSLMLWLDQPLPASGGQRVERFRAPLLFVLELLILLLLGAAACGPFFYHGDSAQAVIVILDDSVSMRAGGARSPRSQALPALQQEFQKTGRYTFQFVAAGARAQLLGPAVSSLDDAEPILARWRCNAATANIAEATALAHQMNASAHLLIVTDRAPDRVVDGAVCWWCLGRPMENRAILVAGRTTSANTDRVLVEILGSDLVSATSTLSVFADDALVKTFPLSLENGTTQRLVFELPHSSRTLRLQLPEDALAEDNVATLPAEQPRVVRVAMRVGDATIRVPIEKALASGPSHRMVSDGADVIVTDAVPTTQEISSAWTLHLAHDEERGAFVGPFIMDRTHPLMDGLDLAGAVWAASTEIDPVGAEVVLAVGNTPLLVDRTTLSGQHAMTLSLRPTASNVTSLPAWPIFFWNLLTYRAAHLPGVSNVHVQLGEHVTGTFDADTRSVLLRAPTGESRTLPTSSSMVRVQADEIGLYEFVAGDRVFRFGVSLMNRDESDLSQCVSERSGVWPSDVANASSVMPLAWLMIVLALAGVAIHHWLLVRRGGVG